MRVRFRGGLAVGVVAMTCGMSPDVDAARSLRVRGLPRVDGHAGRSHGRLLLEGRVVDDAGSPVPSAVITMVVKSGAAPVSLEGMVAACGEAMRKNVIATDESGRFCVWASVPMAMYSVHVEVAASEWLAAASADYVVDLAKRSVALRFDPEPRVVALDAPPAPLDAVATYDDDDANGSGTGAAGLPLDLTTEKNDVIARATTVTGGRATFVVDPKKLGAPGRGAVRVKFGGGEDTMASEHVAPVERDAHVMLALAHDVGASAPEDGVEIEVTATTPSAASTIPTGSIEARLDGVVVGAAALDHGTATVHATFVAPHTSSASLALRYVSDAPWFQAPDELAVNVPIRGPSPWRQAPLAIGALAVAAWLLAGRNARRHRLDRTIVMQRPPTHEGTAGISVVHSSRSRVGTYGGTIVDAHDGSLVPNARVSVQIPSFEGGSVLASVFADEKGKFSFELTTAPTDADLVCEAPLHAELRQKLPGAGVLEIALVSRRRKLLERLVNWARRRGPPFDVRPEPTPGQVRRAAESALPEAADWANAIEQAAYDRVDVDARVEAEVMALDPDKPPARRGPR